MSSAWQPPQTTPVPPGPPAALRAVVVLGPTAVGKTRLAVALARHFNGEIVSADSRQVYRGMDIGTGKDLADYGTGPEQVRAHLLDMVAPQEEYHLHAWLAAATAAIGDICARRRLPVVAGGSPLYLNALLRCYRLPGGGRDEKLRHELEKLSDTELLERLQGCTTPEMLARTDTSQRARLIRAIEIAQAAAHPQPEPATAAAATAIHLTPLVLGIHLPRPEVHRRIEARLDQRLGAGLIEEVAALHSAGVSWQRLDDLGLEYRHVALFLQGRLERREMRDRLLAKIRQFCRSQDIWYRKMEREGLEIRWLQAADPLPEATELVQSFLAGRALPPCTFKLNELTYGPRTGNRRRPA